MPLYLIRSRRLIAKTPALFILLLNHMTGNVTKITRNTNLDNLCLLQKWSQISPFTAPILHSRLFVYIKPRKNKQELSPKGIERKRSVFATLAETIMKAGKLLTVDGRSCEIGGELIKILTVHPLKMMRSLILSENRSSQRETNLEMRDAFFFQNPTGNHSEKSIYVRVKLPRREQRPFLKLLDKMDLICLAGNPISQSGYDMTHSQILHLDRFLSGF